ncbi:hypothetical protein ACPA9J_23370 [Pseudomonas aeruginosa]
MEVPAGFAWTKAGQRREYLRGRLEQGRAVLYPNQSSGVLRQRFLGRGAGGGPRGTYPRGRRGRGVHSAGRTARLSRRWPDGRRSQCAAGSFPPVPVLAGRLPSQPAKLRWNERDSVKRYWAMS